MLGNKLFLCLTALGYLEKDLFYQILHLIPDHIHHLSLAFQVFLLLSIYCNPYYKKYNISILYPQAVYSKAKDPKLSLRVFSLARVAGFEPAHDGIRIHCLTAWRYPNAYLYCLTCLQMGWIVGFEPTHNGATTRCLNHLTIPTI